MAREISVYFFLPFDRDGSGYSSRQLLSLTLSRHTGLSAAAFAEPALTGRGKPYFPDFPALHFSVSHSGVLWACAVDGAPVGLDVQRLLPARRAKAIARRFFHPLEQAYLEARAWDERAFYEVWTAKESCVKYTGQGIDGDFAAFTVCGGEGLSDRVGDAYLTRFSPAPGITDGYAACLCAGEAAAPRTIELDFTEYSV